MPDREKQPDIHILVVDPDEINRQNISLLLEREGYRLHKTAHGATALQILQRHQCAILFTSHHVEDMDGIRLMTLGKQLCPDMEVIFVTDQASVESAVEVMMAGAFSYIPRPFSIEYLLKLVGKALEKTITRAEILRELKEIRNKKGIRFIGKNKAIVKLKSDIAEIAQLDSNVLITGETGTGKELVASTIHALSRRASRRFLPINCSAFTEDLMLNELFGHEKEAFTGASKFRTGLFESADGGTMLLDEIGEMPVIMQAKLLRVLQEKKIIRVGGTRQISVDVRILAATNRDLQKEVKRGNFRQDLYYRINVVSVEIPPLRRRRDDIPLLIHHFLAKYHLPKQQVKTISPAALDILMSYNYPGNVRELENIIERSMAMCREQQIQPYHLPPDLDRHQALHVPVSHDPLPSLTLEEHEREYILSLLARLNGNKSRAARILGIDRVSLWRKLKRYQERGIDVSSYVK